jgi:predicted  nucleic acid-binding Zn-ribbon protein
MPVHDSSVDRTRAKKNNKKQKRTAFLDKSERESSRERRAAESEFKMIIIKCKTQGSRKKENHTHHTDRQTNRDTDTQKRHTDTVEHIYETTGTYITRRLWASQQIDVLDLDDGRFTLETLPRNLKSELAQIA